MVRGGRALATVNLETQKVKLEDGVEDSARREHSEEHNVVQCFFSLWLSPNTSGRGARQRQSRGGVGKHAAPRFRESAMLGSSPLTTRRQCKYEHLSERERKASL